MSRPINTGRGHTDSVTTLSISEQLLASGGEDGNVHIWSLAQSSYPVCSAPRNEACTCVKFSQSKLDVIYSAHSNQLYSWDIRNLSEPTHVWTVNDDEINSFDLLDGEARLCSADDSGTIQIVDTNSGLVVRTLKKHDNICSSVKFRPNRSWQLISGGLDCRVIVSDWKGSGLGVIIFEMDEIVDSVDDDSQTNVLLYSQNIEQESNTSSDDIAEVDFDTDDSESFGTTARASNDIAREESGVSSVHSDSAREILSQADDAHDLNIDNTTSLTNLSDSTVVTNIPSAWRYGLPVNPPMVHVIGCSQNGDFVAAGLESSTIEIFAGSGKRLSHQESLHGHTRGVSALHFLEDNYLLSGGNDRKLFIWKLDEEFNRYHVYHGEKVSAIEGKQLDHVFVADFSPVIQVLDLTAS